MVLVWLTISVFPSLPECLLRATLWCRVSGIDTHEAERKPLILINNGLASYHFHEATLSGNLSDGISTGCFNGTLPFGLFGPLAGNLFAINSI